MYIIDTYRLDTPFFNKSKKLLLLIYKIGIVWWFYIFENRGNYTLMQGKRATSCAANPFWMAKLILLNTTS
jgi:hypothetical protein